MTVSPPWPDDENRTPFPEENTGSRRQDQRSIVLPPTLFQLPNLRVEGAFSRVLTGNQPPQSPSPEAGCGDEVAEMPFENRVSTPDPGKNQDRNEDEPRFPAPPAVVNRLETPATRKTHPSHPPNPQERPAGRSWMDSIGSHGIVVALLLLVVAAALYTGGTGQEDGLDSSLADSRDWLEYDKDKKINLPNPELESASSLDPSVAKVTGVPGAGQADTTGLIDASIDTESLDADVGLPSSVVLSSPVENSRSADVALQNENIQTDNVGIPNVQLEQSRAASTLTPTSPAANRSTPVASAANTPRQSRQPVGYELVVPESKPLQYRQTSTPVGITDWSKYFPNVSAGTADNTSYPSPSN